MADVEANAPLVADDDGGDRDCDWWCVGPDMLSPPMVSRCDRNIDLRLVCIVGLMLLPLSALVALIYD